MTPVMPTRALLGAGAAAALMLGFLAPTASASTSGPVSSTPAAPHVSATAAAIAALPSLVPGDTGTYVRRVQTMLHIAESTVFDAATIKALLAFQTSHGLPANSLVETPTWQALIIDWRQWNRAPRAAAASIASGALLTPFGEPARSRNLAVTTSLRGVYASAYTGRYYLSRFETKRKCIVKRESSGYYTVSGGSYLGAYQFGYGWRSGLVSMMYPELKKEVGSTLAAKLAANLKAKPINKWSRYWQDRAFWTVFNYSGPASGARNWSGGRWPC